MCMLAQQSNHSGFVKLPKHASTVKTLLGFFTALAARAFPMLARHQHLQDIYNYLPIPDLYATSGQPDEAQIRLIADAGYHAVINLAPTSRLENSLAEEAEIVESLGMQYIHLPVDFKNPTTADFDQFVRHLETQTDHPVWVHCAANMRVSAFTYRYRTEILGHDVEEAQRDLQQIWEPVGVWADFIRTPNTLP